MSLPWSSNSISRGIRLSVWASQASTPTSRGTKSLQPQQLCRIHFRHPIDIGDGNASTGEVLIHGEQPIGMKRVVGLSEVARENNELGTDGTDRFHVRLGRIRARAHECQFEISPH